MAYNSGFYVSITNNSNYPQIRYEGIDIAPGFETSIGIERSFFNKLSSPYGNCRDDITTPRSSDSLYYTLASQISQYTRNLCYEICFQYKYCIPMCKCADPSVDSNINNVTLCTISYAKCITTVRKNFLSTNCDSDCPETCSRVKYSSKITMASYPTEYIQQKIRSRSFF